MWNPTVLYIARRDLQTGMVIVNGIHDDAYFQIYTTVINGATFLEYASPWSKVDNAKDEFDLWKATGKRAVS